MAKVLKRHGKKQTFDERKLYASVYYPAREADYSEQEAEELADTVAERVMEWLEEHEDNVLTSDEIKEKAVEQLEELDPDVAFLYKTHLDLS